MVNLSILGSTGSIGKSTLDVVKKHPSSFKVIALAVKNNIKDLEKQARVFRPKLVSVWDQVKSEQLKRCLKGTKIKVLSGENGLLNVATIENSDRVVFALSGTQGLGALLEAIRNKKDIAIANKELIVIAGHIIKKAILKYNVKFVPIDSEHSAIFQCLEGNKRKYLKRIIITASGGPFIDCTKRQLEKVKLKDALNHPRWKMGKKITIDSATMMNKGLEVIEASHLYDININNIDVVIHRESIIHSLVELIDGSLMAQLSMTDMRFPIIYALTYPERIATKFSRPDLVNTGKLSFEAPNFKKFPCLGLAYSAGKTGCTMPIVLNAANEIAVDSFLHKKVSFLKIPSIIKAVMKKHPVKKIYSSEDIYKIDSWARGEALKLCLA